MSYIFLVLLSLRSDSDIKIRRLFNIYLVGMIYWQFVSIMVNLSNTAETALFWYNLLISGTGLYSVLYFPFTRAFLGIKKQKRFAILAYAVALGIFIFGLTGLTFTEARMGDFGTYVPEFTSVVYILSPFGYSFWLFGVFNLIREYLTTKSYFQKNRITYLLIGSAFVILGTASNFTSLQDYPVDITLNLINAIFIAYAVLRFRLLDIRQFLLRSVLYSVITATLVALYIGTIVLVEAVLSETIGYASPISGILAICILAMILLPIRNRLQSIIDGIFFRNRIDYQVATETLSRKATTIRDPNELTSLLINTASDTVRSAGAFALLKNEDESSFIVNSKTETLSHEISDIRIDEKDRLASWFDRTQKPIVTEEIKIDSGMSYLMELHETLFSRPEVSIIVPIFYENALTGLLVLGPKLSGTLYTNDDVRFLTTLANLAATALNNAMVYAEIERRLSEQTLLFIISETFRRTSDTEGSMSEILRVLENFLRVEGCGFAYFDRRRTFRRFSADECLVPILEAIKDKKAALEEYYTLYGDGVFKPPAPLLESLAAAGDTSKVGDFHKHAFIPLRQKSELIGILLIPRKGDSARTDQREVDLLKTIRSIVSQGLMLQRTINNLISVTSYNEHILNSLNDMGDLLIVTNLDRTIGSVNMAACEVLGYTEEELVGGSIDMIAPQDDALFKTERMRGFMDGDSITNYSISLRAKTGEEIPMLYSATALSNEEGKSEAVVGIARDITEHIRAEEVKKNMLMMREIHHRIKNNLQVISSLLYLQSDYVEDDSTKQMFIESQDRVHSMALIHERLYRTEDMAGIEFGQYIESLTRSLLSSYSGQDMTIELNLQLTENVLLSMDAAVPCGLIVNELVTNSLKHGFQAKREGNLLIVLEPFEIDGHTNYRLSVSDDGAGLPDNFDYANSDTLGLQLVTTLVRQLDGVIDVQSREGTSITIEFPERG